MKIILKPLKSKRQLTELSQARPTKASFDTETQTYFTITFKLANGKLCDLVIDFNGRGLPKLLISNFYTDSEV